MIAVEKITLPKASGLTSPNPVTLVCTARPDGGTNVATVSWWTYVSFNPEMIAFAMNQKSYSGERVRETKRVVITVPGAPLADAAIKCGRASGRDVDKAETYGLEMVELPGCDIKIPRHSRVAIECELKEHHAVGDHYLYICDAVRVYGDESEDALFAWSGYSEIATAKKGIGK